jgi:hypothetical protein
MLPCAINLASQANPLTPPALPFSACREIIQRASLAPWSEVISFAVVLALQLAHKKGEQDDDWDRHAQQPKQN